MIRGVPMYENGAQPKSKEDLIIIGSGPAGLTAALYGARAGLNPLVIEGPMPGGQLIESPHVENWPGEHLISGFELLQKIRKHAQLFGARFLEHEVHHVQCVKSPFYLKTQGSLELWTKALIIATGATPKKLGVPGEQEYWGKGVTTCGVCDGPFFKDKPVIIIGGGNRALEQAAFMLNYTHTITIVQLLSAITASPTIAAPLLANPHITVLYTSTVVEIQGDGKHVTHVRIQNQKTGMEDVRPAYGVIMAIGSKPNTELFAGQLARDSASYIIVQDDTSVTSVKGVFAAGDAADHRYRQAITSAGAGCKAALDAEQYLKQYQ